LLLSNIQPVEMMLYGKLHLIACAVTYRVYSVRKQQLVAMLVGGLVVAQPPCFVNIQAVVTCESAQTPVASHILIRLEARAIFPVHKRIETVVPHFLFGDTNGNMQPGKISAGSYFISSTVGVVATPSVLFTFRTCVQ
jgi:hypothetical protein